MKKIIFLLTILVSSLSMYGQETSGIFAELQTTHGVIVVRLEYQKAPITVANFISLAEGTNPFVKIEKLKGKPFYNGLKFHRVISDFMIQGGDPTSGGSGDPGYKFKDEITDFIFDEGGVVAMANAGPITNGSQFFITHKKTPWLDGKFPIFGHVVNGMAVVNNIRQDDVINTIKIIRKGEAAHKFNAPKVFSDYYENKNDLKEPTKAAKSYSNNADFEKIGKALRQNLVGKHFLGGLYDPPCYGIGNVQIADDGEITITGEEKGCNVKFYIKDAKIKLDDVKVKIYQAEPRIDITFYTENATTVYNSLIELNKILNN